MHRRLLLLLTIIIFVQMASANPFDNFGEQFAGFVGENLYDDPDNLLESICAFCGPFAQDCIHLQVQRRTSLSLLEVAPFDTGSNFMNNPAWPTNNLHPYPHSAPAGLTPAGPEPARPQFEHIIQPPREDVDNLRPVQDWLAPTYNAGDRLDKPNPLLLQSPSPSTVGSPSPSTLDSPTPSLSESQPGSRRSGRKRTSPKRNGFPCRNCSRVFNRKTDLNRHNKTHMDDIEKPNRCELCDRAFIYPKDLKRHMDTHVQPDTVHLCPLEYCRYHTKGFTRKDNYKRHMSKQHSISSINTVPSISGASTN